MACDAEVPATSWDVTESQRALELRKFFDPSEAASGGEQCFNAGLNHDGALNAFAETVVLRLGGIRAVISLIDRQTQYFVAGAQRCIASALEKDAFEEFNYEPGWFGKNNRPAQGGLCEKTLALSPHETPYPCFIVNDLTKDSRFADLESVNGIQAKFRFYAGTPITTNNGINIGTFFLFDDKPKPNGLSMGQQKFLRKSADNVMRHFETYREAAERRRAATMTQGIASFMDRMSHITETYMVQNDTSTQGSSRTIKGAHPAQANGIEDAIPGHKPKSNEESVADQIKATLDYAAEIIRESLELKDGGVVFLDSSLGHTEVGLVNLNHALTPSSPKVSGSAVGEDTQDNGEQKKRPKLSPITGNFRTQSCQSVGSHRSNSTERIKPAKVLAASPGTDMDTNSASCPLDSRALNTLIELYPKGNIYYIEDDSYFRSLEQAKAHYDSPASSPAELRRQQVDSRQKTEADMLARTFEKCRQIMFLPLWDAAGGRWYAGCFVWSRTSVPVFTVESELAYLAVFTNSMMIEISRLDALAANKMKSDFISSISHEFRSPLHGILASAESIAESNLDAVQEESILTVQSCGITLLDTINHLLDYSKINSFEKSSERNGYISAELNETCNLALICEEIVDGMIAARTFTKSKVDESSGLSNRQSLVFDGARIFSLSKVNVILDIEERDWTYDILPGALRRIIMNIFGNAQKYTSRGFIVVKLRIFDGECIDQTLSNGYLSRGKFLVFSVKDTGRGMSSEFMERKLYHPFSQEDSFSPGVGLGMSIIWSIVNQLGGTIEVRSEVGAGTEVQVHLPLRGPFPASHGDGNSSTNNGLGCTVSKACQHVAAVRKLARRQTVALWRSEAPDATLRNKDYEWQCLEMYLIDWFGFKVITTTDIGTLPPYVDLLIMDHNVDGYTLPPAVPNDRRVLIIREDLDSPSLTRNGAVGTIRSPVGPYRLARSIRSVLEASNPEPSNRKVSYPEEAISPKSKVLSPKSKVAKFKSPLPYRNQSIVHRHEAENESRASLDITTSSKKTSNLRILVVDDNELNRQLLVRSLRKRQGDEIDTACDGVEAVNAVVNAPEAFDIVFMDISMPNMDGFEATRRIRQHEQATKAPKDHHRAYIIALTGLASKKDRDQARDCGVDDFLTKPMSFRKIGEMLDEFNAKMGL